MSDSKSFKKKRKSRLNSSAEVLHSLLQNSNNNPLGDQFKRWKLWQNWESVVGETIAKSSMPVSYNKRQLIVWVNHPIQLQELLFVKKPLMDKINAYMGHKWILNIHFTLDKKAVPDHSKGNDLSKSLDRLNSGNPKGE